MEFATGSTLSHSRGRGVGVGGCALFGGPFFFILLAKAFSFEVRACVCVGYCSIIRFLFFLASLS